jgi:hypothetical protein
MEQEQEPQIESTGELTIVMRELIALPTSAKIAASVPIEEVHARVLAALDPATGSVNLPHVFTRPGLAINGGRLAYAAKQLHRPGRVRRSKHEHRAEDRPRSDRRRPGTAPWS